MKLKSFYLHSFRDKKFPFDPEEYSRFKHGSLTIAKKYGEELAIGFWENYPVKGLKKQLVAVPSPYYFIPSAASFIKDEFVKVLNVLLVENDMLPLVETKVHRNLSYHEDYGKMNEEQRSILIQGDEFHIDSFFLSGKTSLHIDDVYITGSHEREISKLLAYQQHEHICLYYAKSSTRKTSLEDYINTCCIKDLQGLDRLIKTEKFFFNVRNIRMMLTAEPEEFLEFLHRRSPLFRQELYGWSIGNLYHNVPVYKQNVSLLKEVINEFKHNKPTKAGLA